MNSNVERIIVDTTTQLIKAKYRQGFNDSVASVVRDALYDAKYDNAAREYWIDFCNFDRKFPSGYDNKVEKWGKELVELHFDAYEESKKEGCFKIPSSYGDSFTRGT
jgi:hypothetical protein